MALATTIVLGAVVFLLTWLVQHLTRNHGCLEKLGIPVMKPRGILGSGPFDFSKQLLHETWLEKFREYGVDTWGRYTGVIPTIVTRDPEIMENILAKDFDNFGESMTDHGLADIYKTINLASGDEWYALRRNLSPTFTSGKLKGWTESMSKIADDTMDHLAKILPKSNDGEIEIRRLFQGNAMNTILWCALGLEADAHYNWDNDNFIKYGSVLFDGIRSHNWMEDIGVMLWSHFPVIHPFVQTFPPTFLKMFKMMKDLMNMRTEQDIKTTFFFDRLIEMRKKRAENDPTLKVLSDDTVIAQSIVFFVAGYDTTTNTFCTTSYNLAKHPEIQEKLYKEIKEVMEEHGGELTYDALMDMDYLNAVIHEDLRINGPVHQRFRVCTKDTEVKPGFVVKAGWRVEMPIYACHYNEEVFPEPDKFKPERFSRENMNKLNPFLFRAFGGGRRLCIGKRFALLEVKVLLARMILKYRFCPTERTKLEYNPGDIFLCSFDKMHIKLEDRTG